MQEIVNDIIDTEHAAEKLIRDARERAAVLRSEAEKEISKQIAGAREEAQKLIRESAAKAREQARVEYQKAVSRAEVENTEFLNKHEGKIRGITERVKNLIVTPEYDKT